jgi:hypothetical protein
LHNYFNTDVTFLKKINIHPILGIKKNFLGTTQSLFGLGKKIWCRTIWKGKNGCTQLPQERQDPLLRLLATYPDNFKADFLELPARNVNVSTAIRILL